MYSFNLNNACMCYLNQYGHVFTYYFLFIDKDDDVKCTFRELINMSWPDTDCECSFF